MLDDLRQEKFCMEVATGKSKTYTAAAISAGYSPKTARQAGSRLLTRVDIRRRIKEIRRELLAECGYNDKEIRKMLIRKLCNIWLSDITDFIEISKPDDPNREAVLRELAEANDGQMALDFGEIIFMPMSSLTPDDRSAIKSLKMKTTQVGKQTVIYPEIELHDHLQAAKLLAEITGIKQSDGSVDIKISPAAILEQAYERRAAADEPSKAEISE